MLRFGSRGKFIISDNLEKCLETLNSIRNTCIVTTIPKFGLRRNDDTASCCLIDSTATQANLIQKKIRRLSSKSSINDAQRTCLFNLHVAKQGKLRLINSRLYELRVIRLDNINTKLLYIKFNHLKASD